VVPGRAKFGASIIEPRSPVAVHGHDYIEFAIALNGQCTHVTRGGITSARRGNVIAVRPCDWHGWGRPRDFVLANVYVDQLLLRGALAPFTTQPALRVLAWPVPAQEPPGMGCLAPEPLSRVESAVRALADQEGAAGTLALGYLLVALACLADALPVPAADDPHPAVLTAARRLEDDLTRPWTIAELARAVGLSEGHLHRSFKDAFGATPMEVLTGLRCERAAAHLVASNDPIAQIGRRVGWDDPNYFSRRFRAVHGLSPREYRRQFRN
jgi:AraC family L-rhamnose operon transcriptional activator RhaR